MSKRRSVASKFLWSLMCTLMASALVSVPAFGEAASSTVTPVPGTPIMHGHANYDMAEIGYEQSEFFIEGTADAYARDDTPLTSDGKWTDSAVRSAAYKTRIVVNRPIDAADFNGTVFVEWFNVSAATPTASPFWQQTHVELIRARLCLGGRLGSGSSVSISSSARLRPEPSGLSGSRRSGALRVADRTRVTATPTTSSRRRGRRSATTRRSCSAGSCPSV